MNAQQREAILREMLRQERFGRVLGTQCWTEGYCAALAVRLDGEVSDYYVHDPRQGQCHPDRCPLYFKSNQCQRTAPLYVEGWEAGRKEGQHWLEELICRLSFAPCQVCGKPTGSPRARYCSDACRQRAYRQRKCKTPLQAQV